MNGDGLDDLLLAHVDGSLDLLVFLQDPATHGLQAPHAYPVVAAQSFAHSIDAADLDGDGIPEVVVGSDYGATLLSPAQEFAVTAFIDHWSHLNTARFGDFDGDGKQDLLLLAARDTSPTGNDVLLYRGDGAGHLDAGREALFPEQLCCLADMRAVDFDGDGSLDVAMHMAPVPAFGGYYQGLTGAWGYANNGDGTFKTTNVVYPEVWLRYEAIGGLDVGDLNGDGRPDLAGGIRQNQNSAINGVRATLNLGHTFGHAIERVSHYSWLHGEAVAVGLVAAARLSQRIGLCDSELPEQVEQIVSDVGLPTRFGDLDPQAIYAAMATDKKWQSGKSRFILLRGIGQPEIVSGVDPAAVLDVLRSLQ